MNPVSTTISHPDGRAVGYALWGDPARGLPVIVHCHGSPGGRLQIYSPAGVEECVHIGLDRPGYGLSDPLPGRRMADHAADVALVLDELGVTRFSVLGWSGGGAPALGIGAAMPSRVARILVGGMRAPADTPVFEPEVIQEVLADPEGNRAACEDQARRFLAAPEAWFEGMDKSLAPEEVEWSRTLRPTFRAQLTEAFQPGGEGWFEDDMQLVAPWGFELADVGCEVQLWHGEKDGFVPPAHGRYLAERLPRCESHFVDGEGHGTLLRLLPEMCAWLAEPLL